METTICPWCQTEIVWDEELGPEEECPYCHNELKGYRTLSISLGGEEELEDEEDDHAHHHHDHEDGEDYHNLYWDEEDDGQQHMDAIRRVEAFTSGGGDLLKYETGIEKLLDVQEEVPECPHCREYMIYAGKQSLNLDSFEANIPEGQTQPLLKESAQLNVYVCSACFHVSRFLSEEDRISLIRTVSGDDKEESNK
ncbi:hypothetical protein ACFQ3W_19615 [Paenibacillus puldeungensis]|uniref:Uncharacterized protein n=1 Tax=Paenibacillus puldeungensis TaxID=696536 RepID=A0ABW3S3B7_9BACL